MYEVKSITAQNTWTTALIVEGQFNVSIAGTFVATVTVQRKLDGDSDWRDVSTFTAPIETYGQAVEPDEQYRIGVKTGEFTSGTVNVRIGK